MKAVRATKNLGNKALQNLTALRPLLAKAMTSHPSTELPQPSVRSLELLRAEKSDRDPVAQLDALIEQIERGAPISVRDRAQIRTAMEHFKVDVRDTAAYALKVLADRGELDPDDVIVLKSGLRDSDPYIRATSALALLSGAMRGFSEQQLAGVQRALLELRGWDSRSWLKNLIDRTFLQLQAR